MAGGIYGAGNGNPDPRVAEVEPDRSLWSTIKSDASAAGDFLWTNLIWDSEAPLWMNLGGAAISVVSIAAAIPSGGLSLAGGAALRASIGVVGKAALSEVAVGTASATAMYGAAEVIDYAWGEESEKMLTDEEYEAALDHLSALSTPGSPEALAVAAEREAEAAEAEAETEEETVELSSMEQSYSQTVATLETVLAPFIPDQFEDALINLCALFKIAALGDGDENTNKMEELSFVGSQFLNAVMGKEETQNPPTPANIDRAPERGMALVS
jgi:hypothetical protein